MPESPPTPDQLLAQLSARRTQVRTRRSQEAKVEYWDNSKGTRIKGRISIWAARDGHLRIDVNSNLGLVSSLAVSGQAFQLLDAKNDRYFTGEASTCNVEHVIHVRLPPAQIADALLGDAPVLAHKAAQLSWDGEAKRWVVTLDLEGGGVEELEISERGHNLAKAERRDAAGKRLWWLEHADFTTLKGGVVMPQKSRFQQGDKEGQDVNIRFYDQDVNLDPPAAAWLLESPPGVVQEEMKCEARPE
jgi:hypothetical protein